MRGAHWGGVKVLGACVIVWWRLQCDVGVDDKLHGTGILNLGLEDFQAFTMEAALLEMGLLDCHPKKRDNPCFLISAGLISMLSGAIGTFSKGICGVTPSSIVRSFSNYLSVA